ncbi:hypothetical protein M9H77_17123 [Catharanthus roseus]|uniref:Uncharacterized protein n=1 Tax=Catharanthus roseus TaxID=4058 RepID=A0ACC0B3Q0_CATRO|nr:hypothetical protein M9H77_17123 [Catharanthus roseus]
MSKFRGCRECSQRRRKVWGGFRLNAAEKKRNNSTHCGKGLTVEDAKIWNQVVKKSQVPKVGKTTELRRNCGRGEKAWASVREEIRIMPRILSLWERKSLLTPRIL